MARRASLSFLALTLLLGCLGAGGCGKTDASRRAVRLTLTAPTDGAHLVVRNVLVIGTVEPSDAAVRVGGRRVHVSDGVFRHPMTLRSGLNHIRLTASEAGYDPATMRIAVRTSKSSRAVRSLTRPTATAGPRNATSGFAAKASAICARDLARLKHQTGGPVRLSPASAAAGARYFLQIASDLSHLPVPTSIRREYNRYLDGLRYEAEALRHLRADLERHATAAVKRDSTQIYAVANEVDGLAAGLGLAGC
jgi:hypothetical protein